jgi:D-beta-D-heptose 7-phosphate kinase/D-beta-D-heptose 1-phosphate adenosyltransferase
MNSPDDLMPVPGAKLKESELEARFAGRRILLIGDVMLDRFVYGQVERISPEAPIPIFLIQQERAMLGGAGNVLRNLAALGAHVSFVSVIGKDKAGHEIVSLAGAEEAITPYFITEADRPSTVKTRFVAGTHQMLRADHETKKRLGQDAATQLLQIVEAEMPRHDLVLISDYGKGVLTPPLLEAIAGMARKHGKKMLADPKSRDLGIYRGAFCISPNLHELTNAAGRELASRERIVEAARDIMRECGIKNMLVTCGKDGMILVTPEKTCAIPAQTHEVFDVSGAGDTAIAAFALGVAADFLLEEAAFLANRAAGIAVGRLGTAVVTLQDLRLALFAEAQSASLHKIVPDHAVAAQAARWKREGRRVGFTNGYFDLMHSGHLTLLTRAREACDHLIVAVNSDASVKRMKGEQRPINNEMERALLLASLRAVDLVVIFAEDTPLKLLEAIRPDALIKGADYRKHEVVGHELVESYGGEVVLVPLKEGYSTSSILQKLPELAS